MKKISLLILFFLVIGQYVYGQRPVHILLYEQTDQSCNGPRAVPDVIHCYYYPEENNVILLTSGGDNGSITQVIIVNEGSSTVSFYNESPTDGMLIIPILESGFTTIKVTMDSTRIFEGHFLTN